MYRIENYYRRDSHRGSKFFGLRYGERDSLVTLDHLYQCFSTYFEPRYIFFIGKNHEAHHQSNMLKKYTL